jgi:hypothetical protein
MSNGKKKGVRFPLMPSKNVQLVGIDEVLKNLNQEIRKINGDTSKGLSAAALMVKGRAMVKTPVDTSSLQKSFFTRLDRSENKPSVLIANSAAYAPFVHENLEVKHETGEAKFLENAIKESKQDIINTIKRHLKR